MSEPHVLLCAAITHAWRGLLMVASVRSVSLQSECLISGAVTACLESDTYLSTNTIVYSLPLIRVCTALGVSL